MRTCIAVMFILSLAACNSPHHAPLIERIQHAASTPAPSGEPEWFGKLNEVERVPVPNPGNFSVISRQRELTHFPCKNCHIEEFKISASQKQAAERRSHRDIELKHAPADVMSCATCHSYTDIDSLRKNNGESVSFDHAYQACKSCHFQQFKDWEGGAHGKRHAYWQGQRVVRNCTGCHNPHRPAFEKRWPVTYPSIPRKYE